MTSNKHSYISNLVPNKKTSAGLDSFRMMTEGPGFDQILRTNQVLKSSTNRTTKEIDLLQSTHCNEKLCEISIIAQNIKSLFECLNGVKETEKSNEMLQKVFLICKMN